MAYNQRQNSVSRWAQIVAKYRPHSGQWAWVFHRIAGLALTGYLFLHIQTLTYLTLGKQHYEEHVGAFLSAPFKFAEWALFAFVIFHAMNGMRIVLVDLSDGARKHKAILRTVYIVGIAFMIFTAILIFLNPFETKKHGSTTTSVSGEVHAVGR
jgi:succinate dehydrogenase / fumarate reductase cytochrome b subunit